MYFTVAIGTGDVVVYVYIRFSYYRDRWFACVIMSWCGGGKLAALSSQACAVKKRRGRSSYAYDVSYCVCNNYCCGREKEGFMLLDYMIADGDAKRRGSKRRRYGQNITEYNRAVL